jgi:glutathione peroxidase
MKTIWTLALLGSAVAAIALTTAALAAGPKEKNKVKDPTTAPPARSVANAPASPLDFKVKDIDGKDQDLASYKGKVVMMVNVASRCGNTPQYEGLEALYGKYKDKGLVIIGFPANNFGGQEPGSEAEIKQFCTSKYNVTFPMMSKVSVKGDDKAPVYDWLTGEKTNPEFAGDVTWNFGKFLVDRNGNVIGRFDPGTKPSDPKVVGAIEKALAAKAAGEEKKG